MGNEKDELQFIDLEEADAKESIDAEVLKKNNQKDDQKAKSRQAWTAYFVYVLVLILLGAAFLLYSRSVILEYDALHPNTQLALIENDLSVNGFSEEDFAYLSFGPFDDVEEVKNYLNAGIVGKEITNRFASEDFENNTLKYNLYVDGKRVTEAHLTAKDSFTKLHVFQMSHYETDGVHPPVGPLAAEAIRVTVPEGYEVILNGKKVSEEYITQTNIVEGLEYCGDYVDHLPTVSTYEVDSVFHVKELKVVCGEKEIYSYQNTEDMALRETPTEMNYVVDQTFSYEESDPDEEFTSYVFQVVKDYADFFSGDLAGSAESTYPIRYMFPEGSTYLTLAEQYRTQERRNFTSHTDNHYTDETMDSYIAYGDDLRVCHVTMNKHMNVWGKTVIDPIDTVYYFVKIEDTWRIADMQ